MKKREENVRVQEIGSRYVSILILCMYMYKEQKYVLSTKDIIIFVKTGAVTVLSISALQQGRNCCIFALMYVLCIIVRYLCK